MIVSDRYRCIFVEPPAAAGDGLRTSLSALLDDALTQSLPRFASAKEIRDHLEADRWETFLKFAFVRNPWEMRLAQFYATQPPAEGASLVDAVAFEDFLLTADRSRSAYADYLCDDSGRLMVDFVGRYENLEQDFANLLARIGIDPTTSDLPVFEPVADYAGYYNFLTRDLVAGEFRQDIERFDLRFDMAAGGNDSAMARRRAPGHLIAHFSHHKAGTVWFQRVLKKLAQQLGWKFQSCLQSELDADTQIFMQENSRVELAQLPGFRASHLIRDPRDLVVSGYFYHLWCQEAWCLEKRARYDGRSYQETLNSVSREKGITLEIERCRSTFERMAQWDYTNPALIELRFEDLLADQYAAFERVFRHYGLTAFQVDIGLTAVEQCDFERMTGRKKGEEAEHSHLRKGVAGDWRNHFSASHIDLFESSYPGLLARLGYETGERC